MEQPPEPVRALYQLHESNVKGLQEDGFSYEQAFWIDFAIKSLHPWDDEAEIEIKLSEIFRLYLTIYCDKIDRSLTVGNEPAFLELLKEKWESINESVSPEVDVNLAGLHLGRVVLGAIADNPYLQFKAASYILAITYELWKNRYKHISMKLVKDV